MPYRLATPQYFLFLDFYYIYILTYFFIKIKFLIFIFNGGRRETRTLTVARQILSLVRLPVPPFAHGGSTRIRTEVQGVAGPCLSHLAIEPKMERVMGIEPT